MSEAWSNRWKTKPACERCNDNRVLARRVEAREADLVPCDRCGSMTREELERFRLDMWIKNQTAPTICELDLNLDELQTFKRIREEHPRASKMTVLSWLEAQRYDPSKDEDFLVEAREEFRKWRARP